MATNPFKEISPAFTRSPLGIIALFIVMVYAIAGIAGAATEYDCGQRWVIVSFMVTFPFIVMRVFYLLVTEHSDKIYGPGDFQSDRGFQDYVQGSSSAAEADSAKKLSDWVQQDYNNRGKLDEWLRSNGKQYSVTMFLHSGDVELLDKAVDALVPAGEE